MLPVSTGPVIIRSPVDSTIWTSLAAFILIISTMRAARYYGPGDMRIDEIPEPVAGEGQVKIKVRRIAGRMICRPNCDGLDRLVSYNTFLVIRAYDGPVMTE